MKPKDEPKFVKGGPWLFWAWGWEPGPVFSHLWLGWFHLCRERTVDDRYRWSLGLNAD